MADDAIRFDRTPYKVSYQDLQGKVQTIRRIPPPKLHDMLPTDVVELTQKKSDDFREGDVVDVQAINPRHANTLQLVNKNGDTTFMDYFELNLIDEVAPRPGREEQGKVANNRYLVWP